jgi:hypothetical protein
MADRQQKTPPAAAAADTDAESGSAEDSLRRALFALDAMRTRGLIDEATWTARRQALLAEAAGESPAARE